MSNRRDLPVGDEPALLSLSHETSREVVGSGGEMVGHLTDMTVDLDMHAGPRLVQRLLVKRNGQPDILLPWAAVRKYERTGIHLQDGVDPGTFAVASLLESLGGEEILLVRDVLDTQIVDVVGQRLARVADVALAQTNGGRLELVGVEVGFDAVLRRLGLPGLAARIRRDVVAWTDLHLTSERGHTVQLATPRSAVHHLDADGLAALVSRLDTESATEVLTARGPRVAAGAIRAADPAIGERVLRSMPGENAAEIVAAMPADQATRWRAALARTPALLGRRFIRSTVWPRRRRPRARGSR